MGRTLNTRLVGSLIFHVPVASHVCRAGAVNGFGEINKNGEGTRITSDQLRPEDTARANHERRYDWTSLECVYRAFPSKPEDRRSWRAASAAAYRSLLARGHLGLPALIPGLVHARLATALLAAGYRAKSQLADRSFLCLGCHAGLEVRILRDFGAGGVLGIEIRHDVVAEGVRSQLVEPDEVRIADWWEFLTADDERKTWDEILVLAPQQLSLEKLWDVARPHLVAGGHVVVVAQEGDLRDMPAEVDHGSALEDTMQWYALTN